MQLYCWYSVYIYIDLSWCICTRQMCRCNVLTNSCDITMNCTTYGTHPFLSMSFTPWELGPATGGTPVLWLSQALQRPESETNLGWESLPNLKMVWNRGRNQKKFGCHLSTFCKWLMPCLLQVKIKTHQLRLNCHWVPPTWTHGADLHGEAAEVPSASGSHG